MNKSDHGRMQVKMLAAFPLTTAKDKRWCNHRRSLGHQSCQQVFFQDCSEKGKRPCSQLQLVQT